MHQVSISRILVPVDFSRRAEDAVRAAQRLALHFEAELNLLHVLEPFHLEYAMVELEDSVRTLADANRAKKEAQLAAFVAQDLEGLAIKGIAIKRTTLEGDPATRILECAKASDLVVMPTQGHGRLRGMLIGSVTAKVLDTCEQPVLTGTHLEREHSPADGNIGHILCAVDLGARTASVLRWGSLMSKEFGAKVTVLYVASERNAGERLSAAVQTAELEAELLTRDGEPHKVVTGLASELRAGLVIIGRGTATSTLGRLRAQAYGIVRQSPCPVLSV